jgi:hypothetical protein
MEHPERRRKWGFSCPRVKGRMCFSEKTCLEKKLFRNSCHPSIPVRKCMTHLPQKIKTYLMIRDGYKTPCAPPFLPLYF